MPSVILNKKVLESLIGKKLSIDQLKDRISMLGTDLEKIEGEDIYVEVFPNRPDMLSEQGFARALSSFVGIKTGLRNYKIHKGDSDYKVIVNPSVKKVRPFTACAIIKNLRFTDEKVREVIQIQEKLHVGFGRDRKKLAIGIYPLEKIKLPIRYLAKKPREIKFIPLECDKEMDGLQILQKHPTGRDYAHLLEGNDVFPIFIDANDEILSMPPIINSQKTGKICEKTKDVFIECSGFDYNILSQCLNILVTAMSEMGGDIYQMTVEYTKSNSGKDKKISPDLAPKQWNLDCKYINKILGLELKEKEIIKLLEKMGFGYDSKKEKVLIPAYRTDILHQMDLAEDVAIAYGYENFVPEIPNVSTIGEENEFEIFKTRIGNMLVGLGLIETVSYHITNKEDHNKKMLFESDVVELENALTVDYSVLRSWVIPSLMKILSENTNREYPQNIFEIGTIFKINKEKETGVEENSRLAVALCNQEADFTRIKQVFDALMNALDIQYDSKETEHASFISGRVARISIKGKEVAYVGEINPKLIENFQIEMPIAAFELNLSNLYEIMKNKN